MGPNYETTHCAPTTTAPDRKIMRIRTKIEQLQNRSTENIPGGMIEAYLTLCEPAINGHRD